MHGFILLILVIFAPVIIGGEIALVKDGQPCASIVVGRRPTKSAQLGAFELQHHVKLLTGAELTIAEKPLAGMTPIFLGGQEVGEGSGGVSPPSTQPTNSRHVFLGVITFLILNNRSFVP